MRYLFLNLILLLSIDIYSQSDVILIKGRTLDLKHNPIAYVNISLAKDNSVNTFSNNDGEFEFRIPSINKRDSLVFTSLGFEIYKWQISVVTDSLTIIMRVKDYYLDPVVVSSDTAIRIVRKPILKLINTLPAQKNILQGFYREVIRSDKTYDRLVECAFDLLDNGYHETKQTPLFKIREIRKSDDFRDLDWEASIFEFLFPKNGLHEMISRDFIRSNKNQSYFFENPLNEKWLGELDFALDSIVNFSADKIFRISFQPKPDHISGMLGEGKIYIRIRDFAIMQMDYVIKTDHDSDLGQVLSVPGENYLFKAIIKYRDYEGKMYLNFIHTESIRMGMNFTKFRKSDGKLGLFYDERLLQINEIITEKNKLYRFKKKELQRRNVDLYSNKWNYNEAFWKTYNVVNERQLKPAIRKDLENETSLDEQFKKEH